VHARELRLRAERMVFADARKLRRWQAPQVARSRHEGGHRALCAADIFRTHAMHGAPRARLCNSRHVGHPRRYGAGMSHPAAARHYPKRTPAQMPARLTHV
jgi:hypothetical protein